MSDTGTRLHDRRALLAAFGGGALLGAGGIALGQRLARPGREGVFSLGVASGDPTADGFVLWTRLAPEPLDPRGGMAPTPVEVTWVVARDEALRDVVATGTEIARPELGHAVHAEVAGLEPDGRWFYAFTHAGRRSPVGRARTLPAPGASPVSLTLAHAGGMHWEHGYFTAWRRLAEDAPDLTYLYGKAIYEDAFHAADGTPRVRGLPVRTPEPLTLTDYRLRHAAYRRDGDLQAGFAGTTLLAMFDDHEVQDNWTGEGPSDLTGGGVPPEVFALRRAAALQAWYEHMPVRRALLPRGPDIRAHRSFRWGDLAALHLLDTRSQRSKQPCGDGWRDCPAADDPGLTMLGAEQEAWLARGLAGDAATWTVLGAGVPVMPLAREEGGRMLHAMDKWSGARAARARLLGDLAAARNPIVLTGDMNVTFVGDLILDGLTVGAEFHAPSVSAWGDGEDAIEGIEAWFSANPGLRAANGRRGYLLHRVTREGWRAELRVVDRVSAPGAPVRTAATYTVEAGRPGVAASRPASQASSGAGRGTAAR